VPGTPSSGHLVRTKTEKAVSPTHVFQNNYITNNYNYKIVDKEDPNLRAKSSSS